MELAVQFMMFYMCQRVSTPPKKGFIDFLLWWLRFSTAVGSKDGFMVDVWWGITEPKPKEYNFAPYRRLIDEDWPMFGANDGDGVIGRIWKL